MNTTRLDWQLIASQLTFDGFAVLQGVPGAAHARSWANELAPHFGSVRELDDAELPEPLRAWRRRLYERLVPTANSWEEAMGSANRFPSEWPEFLARNRDAGQLRPQSFVHRLGTSTYEPLHQRREGLHVFPFQQLILLSDPRTEFSGGEVVITERRPRMQSRAIVVPLALGDAALIPTAKRPVKGSQGYYTTDAKHGVSRVRNGQRLGLEISFHCAP